MFAMAYQDLVWDFARADADGSAPYALRVFTGSTEPYRAVQEGLLPPALPVQLPSASEVLLGVGPDRARPRSGLAFEGGRRLWRALPAAVTTVLRERLAEARPERPLRLQIRSLSH